MQDSVPGRRKNLSLFQNSQAGSEAHLASYSKVSWNMKVTTHIQLVPSLRMCGIKPPLPYKPSCIERNTFTFSSLLTMPTSPDVPFIKVPQTLCVFLSFSFLHVLPISILRISPR